MKNPDSDTHLDSELGAFEDSLRQLVPSPVSAELKQELAGAVEPTENIIPFRSRVLPILVPLAAAAVLAVAVVTGLLRSGNGDGQEIVLPAPDPIENPSLVLSLGVERQLLSVEKLGLVQLQDGHPHNGYRLRYRDTGSWETEPDNLLHISQENEGVLYLPVVFH